MFHRKRHPHNNSPPRSSLTNVRVAHMPPIHVAVPPSTSSSPSAPPSSLSARPTMSPGDVVKALLNDRHVSSCQECSSAAAAAASSSSLSGSRSALPPPSPSSSSPSPSSSSSYAPSLNGTCVAASSGTAAPNCAFCTVAQHATLSHCGLSDVHAMYIAITLVDPSCPLTSLDLSRNEICTTAGVEWLAYGLQHNVNLMYLSLAATGLEANGVKRIAKTNMSNLVHLDLSKNKRIGSEKSEATGLKAILKHFVRLRSLILIDIGLLSAASLFHGLQLSNSLVHLILRGNSIGDAGAQMISEAVKVGKVPLLQLDLAYNKIGDVGAKSIASTLSITTVTIAHLDLEGNLLTTSGVTTLAMALISNTSLLSLTLNENKGIADEGLQALASTFALNRTLWELNLSGAGSSCPGLGYLCRGLDRNPTLLALRLSRNNFTAESVVPLLENKKLQRLNLSRAITNTEPRGDICSPIHASSLLHLDLSGNKCLLDSQEILDLIKTSKLQYLALKGLFTNAKSSDVLDACVKSKSALSVVIGNASDNHPNQPSPEIITEDHIKAHFASKAEQQQKGDHFLFAGRRLPPPYTNTVALLGCGFSDAVFVLLWQGPAVTSSAPHVCDPTFCLSDTILILELPDKLPPPFTLQVVLNGRFSLGQDHITIDPKWCALYPHYFAWFRDYQDAQPSVALELSKITVKPAKSSKSTKSFIVICDQSNYKFKCVSVEQRQQWTHTMLSLQAKSSSSKILGTSAPAVSSSLSHGSHSNGPAVSQPRPTTNHTVYPTPHSSTQQPIAHPSATIPISTILMNDFTHITPIHQQPTTSNDSSMDINPFTTSATRAIPSRRKNHIEYHGEPQPSALDLTETHAPAVTVSSPPGGGGFFPADEDFFAFAPASFINSTSTTATATAVVPNTSPTTAVSHQVQPLSTDDSHNTPMPLRASFSSPSLLL
ncbi:hypothetical protein Pelo_8048 [Pelomyxa schiedti]|nr:hypothetical protein Pelo_8048 [Pelomyxa schiedti]